MAFIKLAEWGFSLRPITKKIIKISFDVLLINLSMVAAFFLRQENLAFLSDVKLTCLALGLSLFTISIFLKLGLYDNISRYNQLSSMSTITIGAVFTGLVYFSIINVLPLNIPNGIPLIFVILTALSVTSVRLFAFDIEKNRTIVAQKNVAIYGAGAAGNEIANTLKNDNSYNVRFFVDDNPVLDGRRINGIPIFGRDTAISKIPKYNIDVLLLAAPSNPSKLRENALNLLSDHPLVVKTVPRLNDIISGNANFVDLQPLNIEDLMGRSPVEPNESLMSNNITGKSVIITGAGGSIGSELCRQVIKYAPKRLLVLDVSEISIYNLLQDTSLENSFKSNVIVPIVGSVLDPSFLRHIMAKFSIDTVYHAAAYKHVPLMEQNLVQCVKNNVFGTLNVLDEAITAKVENFVLISTDKAVEPSNHMGASKRIAELICQSKSDAQNHTKIAIVRFGNVLGSSGSVIPLFREQIQSGGPITVTNEEVTRYFMTISEAAQLVIQASSISQGGEVFVLDMGEPIKIIDLAKKMSILYGLKPLVGAQGAIKVGTIHIEIVGLRPGEKLHEKLFYGNNLNATKHPRIWKASDEDINSNSLNDSLSQLRPALEGANHKQISKIISLII